LLGNTYLNVLTGFSWYQCVNRHQIIFVGVRVFAIGAVILKTGFKVLCKGKNWCKIAVFE
jgi:hypothetical protein